MARLTLKQKLDIYTTVSANIEKSGDKLFKYVNNMSDKAIADKLGVPPSSVKYVRQSGFGELITGRAEEHGKSVKYMELVSRLRGAEASIELLLEEVQRLGEQVEILTHRMAGRLL